MKSLFDSFRVGLSWMVVLFILTPLDFSYHQAFSNQNTYTLCSFNIKFLGHYKNRENKFLSNVLKPCDLVTIQELVRTVDDSQQVEIKGQKPSKDAQDFVYSMKDAGFNSAFSVEGTGQFDEYVYANSLEWQVLFYKASKLQLDTNTQTGYIASKIRNNPDFDRVPFSFRLKTSDGKADFVIISVHLSAKLGDEGKQKRAKEMVKISEWVKNQKQKTRERNYFVFGDMNIQDKQELSEITPEGFISLNRDKNGNPLPTNTNFFNPKPLDQIFYEPNETDFVSTSESMQVISLVDAINLAFSRERSTFVNPLIDLPVSQTNYNHNVFRYVFSDHNPVFFQIHPKRDMD